MLEYNNKNLFRTMDKFIGKINGVEYASREEFCKVLGELKPEDIKSISLIEQSTNEAHEEKEPTTVDDALRDLMQTKELEIKE